MYASVYENLRRLAEKTVPTKDALSRYENERAPKQVLITIAAAKIAQALSTNLDHISNDEVRSVFSLAEDLLVLADEETKDAVTTGFLESLAASSSEGKLEFRRIAQFIGPECRKYWQAWDKFTGATTPGLDSE